MHVSARARKKLDAARRRAVLSVRYSCRPSPTLVDPIF
jgi:hypothetical protein